MSILIKNSENYGNVYVEGNEIVSVSVKDVSQKTDHVIDARGKAVLPGLVNTHTHAAMTLLRGYGDDMLLHDWLTTKIWPAESKLKPEHVYWGTRLAALEMIKTGTTTFNDMYFFMENAVEAVKDSGLRAVLAYGFLDLFEEEKREKEIKETEKFAKYVKSMKEDRIKAAVAPHAVYTVSKEGFQWCKEFADEQGMLLHVHLSETRKENEDCVDANGKRPVPYLDDIGFLGENVVAAHCVWLTKGEVSLLAKRGVKVSHNPTSNMKLATGGVMPYKEMHDAGVTIGLGTDGAASNNNLDMFEEMKIAALLQKAHRWDPTVLPAKEAWEMATINGARVLNINAGEVRSGMLADLILVDLQKPEMTPNHDLISNLVYSANGSVVTHTICNGQLLMDERVVEDEEKILEKARKIAKDLVG